VRLWPEVVLRPRTFAAAVCAAGAIGFLLGRCTTPATSRIELVGSETTLGRDDQGATRIETVIDGDTLVVSFRNSPTGEEKIRLLGVDTPERGQSWYAESKAELQELAKGRLVQIEFEDPAAARRDKYGRLLAFVVVDGTVVNIEIVRRGWSPYVSKYGGERYRRELIAAEEEARAAHRGVWSTR